MPRVSGEAEQLIEQMMVTANIAAAKFSLDHKLPFLYRVHGTPDPKRVEELVTLLQLVGVPCKEIVKPNPETQDFAAILDRVRGLPCETLVSQRLLRTMEKARYSTEETGHFGLALSDYSHYTSPIRRYPDLQIHRIIKECLHGNMDARKTAHFEKILPEVAVQTSALERRAAEAERETDMMKKVQYMEHYIGEEFEGVISGVTNWGFYVELPNTVEGLVHVNELRGDYFVFDEAHYELVGEMTRKTYKLGQTIRVRVTACDRYARTIDFMPAVYWK